MKLEFSQQIFDKLSNIKFHENPSSAPCGRPEGRTDGMTDMKKLTVVFRNFAKAPTIKVVNSAIGNEASKPHPETRTQ